MCFKTLIFYFGKFKHAWNAAWLWSPRFHHPSFNTYNIYHSYHISSPLLFLFVRRTLKQSPDVISLASVITLQCTFNRYLKNNHNAIIISNTVEGNSLWHIHSSTWFLFNCSPWLSKNCLLYSWFMWTTYCIWWTCLLVCIISFLKCHLAVRISHLSCRIPNVVHLKGHLLCKIWTQRKITRRSSKMN